MWVLFTTMRRYTYCAPVYFSCDISHGKRLVKTPPVFVTAPTQMIWIKTRRKKEREEPSSRFQYSRLYADSNKKKTLRLLTCISGTQRNCVEKSQEWRQPGSSHGIYEFIQWKHTVNWMSAYCCTTSRVERLVCFLLNFCHLPFLAGFTDGVSAEFIK